MIGWNMHIVFNVLKITSSVYLPLEVTASIKWNRFPCGLHGKCAATDHGQLVNWVTHCVLLFSKN